MEEDLSRIRQQEIALRCSKLRADTLAFIVDHEGDVKDYLDFFGDRILASVECDQVIFQGTEGEPLVYNAHGLPEGTSEFGSFDAERVFSNGKLAGTLRFNYLEEGLTFSDDELEMFRILAQYTGLLLGRIEAARLKRRTVELEASKRTLGMLFALADEYDPVIVIDPDTGKYEWHVSRDAVTEQITNMSVTGGNLYDDSALDIASLIYEEDMEKYAKLCSRENLMKVAGTGESQSIEIRWYFENEGRYRWQRIKVVRMIDESGQPLVVSGVVDIDDIKAQERAREEQRIQDRENLEVISGLAGEYVGLYYVNLDERAFRIYSIDDGRIADTRKLVSEQVDVFELLHRFTNASVHPDDRQPLLDTDYDSVRKLLAHRKRYTVRYRRDYGQGWLWSEMDLVKCEDVDEPANIVIIGFAERDSVIRQEWERQNQLEEALSMAQSASRSKTLFLNSMSHDIRTPMNAIIGYTSMARKCIDDKPKALDYLDKIGMAGGNLLELVNQVLDMSRIESGTVVLGEEPADVVEKAYEMTEIIGHSAQMKGIRLSTVIENVTDRKVLADAGRVNQMMMNILGNAIKYTPEGGHVVYSVSQIPCDKPGFATYVFSVKDDGIGMSKDYVERIFEPFSRENTSTVSRIQGTGLGMSIVKKLTDLMGGGIEVQSEQGKGTDITLTLSFRLDSSAQVAPQDASGSGEGFTVLNGKRVLLVEDNEMNREIATMLLEEQGLVVETAEDGDVAVEKVRAVAEREDWRYYDFILMDVQMPRMNGYDAARAIRAIPAPSDVRVPIIAMTANAFAEDRQNALDAGMDAHVAKPIDVNALWETLVKFVR